MMKIATPLLVLCLLIFRVSAQDVKPLHRISPAEEKLMPGYIRNHQVNQNRQIPSQPPTPVRTMAEWEQIQAVTIAWTSQPTILREIVRNAVRECKVMIITTDSANVKNQLTNAGIGLDSVRFVVTPFNSIWVCDYGAWSVYSNDVDSLWQIDWIYNRPRPQDDASPLAVADYLNIPVYEATTEPDDWVHTGGNHFSDGLKNAFSSMLVLEENNDKTEAEIDTIAKKFLGVEQYIKFPVLPYDGIHHLDMHMRIIDEETIIVGEYPDGVADGPQINANLEYLENEVKTSFGHPYRIVRMPMPPDANNRYPDNGGNYRTYTNAVFLNKTLLVPTYQEKYDTTALRIYRENLPGYNVVGINCNSIIGSLGALHCITRTIGVTDPLLIAHARLRDADHADQDYPVTAMIKHSTGIAGADLYYRISGDSVYSKVEMAWTDTLKNIWSAIIPAQSAGKEVQYYMEARSNSGKTQVRPIVAPEGYFKFQIKAEDINQPPETNITFPADHSVYSIDVSSLIIRADASDSDGIVEKLILYMNGDSIRAVVNEPYEFDWSFSSEGEFVFQTKAIDDDGAETLSAPVHVIIEGTTAVIDPTHIVMKGYPNPVSNIFWIEDADISSMYVSDYLGQSQQATIQREGNKCGVDLSKLTSGIYFIKVLKEGKPESIKVIKR